MADSNESVARQLVDDLLANPLTPEELAARRPKLPELRLAPNTPIMTVDEVSRLTDLLPKVQDADEGIVALSEQGTTPSAVVIPLKQYLELVGIQLALDPLVQRGTATGSIAPTSDELAARHVEQVDPTAAW